MYVSQTATRNAKAKPQESPVSCGSDRHGRPLVLGTMSTDGMPALDLALIQARAGDRVVAAMAVGELLRALPDVGWLTAHDPFGAPGSATTRESVT